MTFQKEEALLDLVLVLLFFAVCYCLRAQDVLTAEQLEAKRPIQAWQVGADHNLSERYKVDMQGTPRKNR